MKKYIIPLLLIAFLLGAILFRGNISLAGDGFAAYDCTATDSLVAIGDDITTEVLDANSRRAYAIIQLEQDTLGVATNTVSVAFDESATLANGFELATSTPTLEFGLNEDLPFTGTVNVITSTGSTTMRVIECVYNR